MRKGFAENAPEAPAADPAHPQVDCASAASASDAATLQVALYACFDEIGNHIDFDGQRIVRTTALQTLQQLPDAERRKRLFLALSPLWIAVNGADTADSPYRRMMVLNGAALRRERRLPVANAAATLGIRHAASRALAGTGARGLARAVARPGARALGLLVCIGGRQS